MIHRSFLGKLNMRKHNKLKYTHTVIFNYGFACKQPILFSPFPLSQFDHSRHSFCSKAFLAICFEDIYHYIQFVLFFSRTFHPPWAALETYIPCFASLGKIDAACKELIMGINGYTSITQVFYGLTAVLVCGVHYNYQKLYIFIGLHAFMNCLTGLNKFMNMLIRNDKT